MSSRDDILASVPSLRAFAISLCGNVDRADDLVQDCIERALRQSEKPAALIIWMSGACWS